MPFEILQPMIDNFDLFFDNRHPLGKMIVLCNFFRKVINFRVNYSLMYFEFVLYFSVACFGAPASVATADIMLTIILSICLNPP